MVAFTQALAQGADALELDVRTTADDVPVVLHDATLDRTTNVRGEVARLRLDQVRDADAGKGERIPLLSEVLEHFPRTPLIVEIKERRAGGAVRRVVAEQGAGSRILVGSFEHAALTSFGPGWFRSASRRETAIFWAAARVGAPRWSPRYAAFTVPERHGRLRVVDRAFVARAGKAGIPVHVWTVNDAADARRLRAMGVCGLITNFPATMRRLDS